jgi:type VI secretion system protein VasD
VLRRAAGLLLISLAVFLAGAGSVTAFGCSPTIVVPKEPDRCKLQLVDMAIMASARLNPTDNGEARPVQLRIYQLTTDVRLNNSDFEKIWKADKATLGDDLVKVEEMSIFPDSRTDIRFERDEKALYVAAVALFRTPRGRSWYTVMELPPAPGKGDCQVLECDGGGCKEQQNRLNPHYYVWLDGTRVDDGEDRLDEFPVPGRRRKETFRGGSGEAR